MTIVWSGVVAFVAYKLVDLTIGLRVSEEDEREGLDTSGPRRGGLSHVSTRCCSGRRKGRSGAPFFYPHELLEQPEELLPFGGGQAGRHAALVQLDAALQPREPDRGRTRVSHSPLVRRSSPRLRSTSPRPSST